ncbi:MAG: BPL-N domain-containing protein [Promethearchaeota archaeon]
MTKPASKKVLTKVGLAIFIASILLFPVVFHHTEQNFVIAQSDLTGIHVGVFNAGTLATDSEIALRALFEWMGATVQWVDGPSVRGGVLNELDIIAFPGGSMRSYSFNLTQAGMDQIRQFVAMGGSYFGICGGALFATEFLSLSSGTWDTEIPDIGGGTHLTVMNVHQNSTGPDLSDEPSTYETLYWGSSFFTPLNPSSIIPIMSYPENNEPGMFVARYGSGTFFCSSPHPEYEEGDNRDGTSQFDYLDDPDSEWGLLQKITQWLIDESPYNPLPLTGLNSILIIASVAVIIIVALGITLYYKRKPSSK